MSFDIYMPIFDPIGVPCVTLRDIYGHFVLPGTKKFRAYFRRRKKLCCK